MSTLSVVFSIAIIIVGSLLAWSYTKSGKKWLENL